MFPALSLTALRAVRIMLVILAVLLALTVLAVHQTRAQTTVTVADGDVPGLIYAIESANGSSFAVTIELASSGNYELTAEYAGDSSSGNGLPAITSEIIIAGNGATIHRNPNSESFRIFEIVPDGHLHLVSVTVSGGESPRGGGILVNDGNLSLTDSAINNNNAGVAGGGILVDDGNLSVTDSSINNNNSSLVGGGVYHYGGDLTLTDSSISDNNADDSGGGIFVDTSSTVEVTGGLISGNTADYGAGIYNLHTLTLTSSVVRDNKAKDGGGYQGGGGEAVLIVTRTTISGNEANDGPGGGISNYGGEVTLINSTVSGNEASDEGGGILNYSLFGSEVTLINSTVSGNKANDGGGIDNHLGELTLISSTISDNEAVSGSGIRSTGNLMLTGSIVAGNTTTPGTNTIVANIEGAIDSNVASFIEADPQLGPLQNNGGLTETHQPLPGSPVLDQIPEGDFGCGVAGQTDTDQRGVPRPQGTHCDIGAVELEQDFGFDHMEHIPNPWFWATWARTDSPVRNGLIARTWMWGPGPFTTSMWEPYTTNLQNPGGDPVVMDASQGAIPDATREVIYFDKAKMEINDPEGDTDSIWFVTNGLLVVEMITGNRQFGDDLFISYEPSNSNVAGDADDMNGPTYASFQSVLDAPAQAVGTLLTQQVDRSGNVTSSSSWGAFGVTIGHVDPVTDHGIAGPFWEFMNSQGLVHEDGNTFEDALFENPYYATGRPVTEAYWADVKVAGEQRGVLMQCFERRCLTYTPGNSPGFIVEAGNVGQHYYYWRYIQAPD